MSVLENRLWFLLQVVHEQGHPALLKQPHTYKNSIYYEGPTQSMAFLLSFIAPLYAEDSVPWALCCHSYS